MIQEGGSGRHPALSRTVISRGYPAPARLHNSSKFSNEFGPRTRAWRSGSAAHGLIFFAQGVLKYIDPNMGVNRFAKIGFPHPYFTAHFVGTFEMVCGFLVLIGLVIRIAAIPLLVVICTAIVTTKIPELSRPNQGFWFMVSDARADFSMLMPCCS